MKTTKTTRERERERWSDIDGNDHDKDDEDARMRMTTMTIKRPMMKVQKIEYDINLLWKDSRPREARPKNLVYI